MCRHKIICEQWEGGAFSDISSISPPDHSITSAFSFKVYELSLFCYLDLFASQQEETKLS